ncbi:MAG: ComEA family DNA-binding protein [Oscillospiraceae bacterium]|nr:ComEA family DNA-binding protein [Oscillospiraceae bacterium]
MNQQKAEIILWSLSGLLLAAVVFVSLATLPDFAPVRPAGEDTPATAAIFNPAASPDSSPSDNPSSGFTKSPLDSSTPPSDSSQPPPNSSKSPPNSSESPPDSPQSSPDSSEPSSAKTSHPPGKLNLNYATAEELMSINGIGTVTAGKIIRYRETHGGFSAVEELLNIDGIGEKSLAKWREYFIV